MTVFTRRRVVALGATAAALPSSLRAQATWPTSPVTFVVGYAPGGSTDINGRELAAVMSPILGQQIVVDNKGGANGSIAARAVANARPDGYMLFYAPSQTIVVNPHIQKGSIDTITALAPVCQTTAYQYVLAVNPKVPANTVAELVALARKDPDKLTFSSAGVGAGTHLAGALFVAATGIRVTHVPYKGTGPALADVISGQITMEFSTLPSAVPQIKVGNLKALAVTGSPRLKSCPTTDAQGAGHRRGGDRLARPVRAGQDRRRPPRQDREGRQAGDERPQWKEALAKDGVDLPPERSRAEFARSVADEHAFWGKKLKAMKLDVE